MSTAILFSFVTVVLVGVAMGSEVDLLVKPGIWIPIGTPPAPPTQVVLDCFGCCGFYHCAGVVTDTCTPAKAPAQPPCTNINGDLLTTAVGCFPSTPTATCTDPAVCKAHPTVTNTCSAAIPTACATGPKQVCDPAP